VSLPSTAEMVTFNPLRGRSADARAVAKRRAILFAAHRATPIAREPSHFLAQPHPGRSEQIGEDQKTVALLLCQLRWRQLHIACSANPVLLLSL